MPMLQLDPLIPVLVKHQDEWVKGMAHVLIDYSLEHDLYWVVFLDGNRECWTVQNKNIRIQENISAGRYPLPFASNLRTVVNPTAADDDVFAPIQPRK